MNKLATAGAVALLALVSTSAAQATVVDLTFEGINATYPSGFAQILDFYSGGTSSDGTTGTNYGITFSDNALAICLNTPGVVCSNTSRGGLGDPNSQKGGLFFLSGSSTAMDFAAGFDTGFSFNYPEPNTVGGSVSVYSGLDGTGTLLATLNLALTPSTCDPSTYSAGYCPFIAEGVTFAGVGQSIVFSGVADFVVFGDVTFGSATPGNTNVPESLTLALFGAGLTGLAGLRRRRSKKAA